MKIIEPSFEIIPITSNPQKYIESIARTCYKSDNLITGDSNKKFITNLYNHKHWAMLEHYIFIYQVDMFTSDFDTEKYFITSKTVGKDGKLHKLISFNARSLLDMLEKYNNISNIKNRIISLIKQVIYDYECEELFGNKFNKKKSIIYKKIDIDDLTSKEKMIHGWQSVKFICDRGISHEIVRHRDASFAQESTRYCNYSKDKYGKEITVIKPFYLNDDYNASTDEIAAYGVWEIAMRESEKAYFKMLDLGYSAQEARAVLPNSLKTELIMTARNYEWKHFFELRCDKSAHPQIRELAIPLSKIMNL